MSASRHHNALEPGYRLHWYRIESVLGQGGFGITCLATDKVQRTTSPARETARAVRELLAALYKARGL